MIDIATETLIRIADVPKHLPSRNGRRLHVSAVYRWIKRGVKGKKLESIKIGGTTYTSIEALQRFADADAPTQIRGNGERPSCHSRRREIERASRTADRLLNKSNGKTDDR